MKKILDRARLIHIFRVYLKEINSPQNPHFETYSEIDLLKVAYLYRIIVDSSFFI